MNFMIFLLSFTTWKSNQARPTFYLLGIDADCPHKNENLQLFLVMKKTDACPKKGMKSGVNRDSHLVKNCHHFCCALARTTYGSPADKYNLFLFFPISHAHFICGILKLHTKCLLTPWHHSIPRLGCAISQNPPLQLWKVKANRERTWVQGPSDYFPVSIGKGQTLSIFRQSCLYVRKLIASWLNYKLPC